MMQHKSNVDCLRLIRKEIRNSSAYVPSDSNVICKLDAMEMPYDLDDDIKNLWLDKLSQCQINRYPTGQADFIERLRLHFSAEQDCGILIGNGSDELLQILAMAVTDPNGSPVYTLAVDPDFSMYPVIAKNCGVQHTAVELKEDFSLDIKAFLQAIERYQPAIVWLSRPNNPTGQVWRSEDIDLIIEHSPGMVLIDEAYHAFFGQSHIDRLGQFDNLLISRTFSKIGLAGLRFGVLLGHSSIISELNKIRLPYNVNSLTQASIEFALDHYDHFERNIELIKQQRQRLYDLLCKTDRVTPLPSATNFILARVECRSVSDLYNKLCAKGILVKHFSERMLQQYIRVTVGNEYENDMFIKELREILATER